MTVHRVRTIAELRERARQTGSASLVLWQNGRVVADSHASSAHRAHDLSSVTKVVVAVALGAAFGDEACDVLDRPLTTWIHEWRGSAKSAITLRHVLTHRSGLKGLLPRSVRRAVDVVRSAIHAPLVDEPGSRHIYNDLAVNLVSEVVVRATQRTLDEVLARDVLGPLGVSDWSWRRDRAGHVRCHDGLSMRADDLVKIGVLLMDGGRWKGERVLPDGWSDAMAPERDADTGLLCLGFYAWQTYDVTSRVLEEWRQAGVDADVIDRVEHRRGGQADDLGSYLGRRRWLKLEQAVVSGGLRFGEIHNGPVLGYGHSGDGGQYLVVLPDQRAVAVRLRPGWRLRATGPTLWSTFPVDVCAALG